MCCIVYRFIKVDFIEMDKKTFSLTYDDSEEAQFFQRPHVKN